MPIAVMTALATGCPTGGGNGGGGDEVALADVGGEVAKIICNVMIECYGFSSDRASCESEWTAQFEDQTQKLWENAVDKGTFQYDGKKMRECLDALAAGGCTAFAGDAPPAVCDEALQGTVASGGACNVDEECAGDAHCDTRSACPGTCVDYVAEGGDCSSASCKLGLECLNNTCVAKAKLGEACRGESSPGCAAGLTCDGDTATQSGTCVEEAPLTRVDEGQSCDPQNAVFCNEGLSCVVDSVGSSGPVWKCQAQVAAGAACKAGRPDPCPTTQYCAGVNPPATMEGTCTDKPTEGQDCGDSLIGGGICASGLICDSNNKCAKVQRLGGSCSSDEVCASGFCDNGSCAVPECA
jgi:hypothetical protein